MVQKIEATDVTEEEALNAAFLNVQMNLLSKQTIFVALKKVHK
jgi:hypothetical protein